MFKTINDMFIMKTDILIKQAFVLIAIRLLRNCTLFVKEVAGRNS